MAETATRRRNGHEGSAPTKASTKAATKAKAPTKASTKAATKTKPPTKASTKPKGISPPKTGSQARSATKAKAKQRRPAAAAKQTVSRATEAVVENTPSVPKPNRFARKLAGKAIRKVGTRALEAGAGVIRAAADRAAATGSEAVEKTAKKRLPIQRSVDIAVPLRVAWEEWMALESLPEGVQTVTEIEREGNELIGRTSGPRARNWVAEILDEREQQSFAWQSHEGSDCAGLATFHDLSRRLTRIELNLDVIPTSLAETVALATHVADRHAEAELRRFKARLELINPDAYETDEAASDEAPEDEESTDEELTDEAPEPDDQPQHDTDEQDARA